MTACVRYQNVFGGGLDERPNTLNGAVAVYPHGEMEGGASRTAHPDLCISSAFGKCAQITTDGLRFLRSTEHCAPWPIRRCCRAGRGVRIMFAGGGVSNS